MSITGVEQNPVGDDVVHIADPGTDAVAEPHHGTDTLDAITHIKQHGRGRVLGDNPAFHGVVGRKDRPTSADIDEVLTGVPGETVRELHDEAVQVRQLLPAAWDVRSVSLGSLQPAQIMADRPERITFQLYNVGPATIYVGPLASKATPATGFPVAPGATLIMNNLGQVWGSVDTGTGASADVRVVETWRTDNIGN